MPQSMSRHEGVSCDACMRSNFGGDRFKCLRCYDFDLCRGCYESARFGGANDHQDDHPVQCVMTRDDFDFMYAGESTSSSELRVLVFTCPYCGQFGLSLDGLHEHVATEHSDAHVEVICPVCVATPHADPNRLTDDLPAHLAAEHVGRQERIPREEPRGQRRAHPGGGTGGGLRSRGAVRARALGSRTERDLSSPRSLAAAADDPMADRMTLELLNQLGGMRRSNSNYASTMAQIQQLQQQLGRRAPRSTRYVDSARVDSQPSSRTSADELSGSPADRHMYDSMELYQRMAAASVGERFDGANSEFWSEILGSGAGGGGGGASVSVTVLERHPEYAALAARERALTLEPRRAAASASNNNNAAAAAASAASLASLQTPAGAPAAAPDDAWNDARFLIPRLFERNLSEEEKAKEAALKSERAEFVAELCLSMAMTDEASLKQSPVSEERSSE